MSLLRYYYALLASLSLPAPLLDYQPQHAHPSGWVNSGTGGAAFDLLPEAGTAELVAGPNGASARRLGPGVSLQTTGAVPIAGTQPRTLFALVRLSSTEDGALLGWGAAVQGQLFDLLAYQEALQIHVYGDQRVVRDNEAGQWLAVLVTGQLEGGTFILRDQVNGTLTPTDPAVDTSPGTLTLGRGRFNDREATLEVCALRIWDGALTAEERAVLAEKCQELYQIAI